MVLGGQMAEITLGTLMAFVTKHGNLKIIDRSGTTRMLQPGVPDSFDLAEKADRFFFGERWYTRAEFQKLMDES